jgi:hypothetical protein
MVIDRTSATTLVATEAFLATDFQGDITCLTI